MVALRGGLNLDYGVDDDRTGSDVMCLSRAFVWPLNWLALPLAQVEQVRGVVVSMAEVWRLGTVPVLAMGMRQ